jgi:hypothetical protein
MTIVNATKKAWDRLKATPSSANNVDDTILGSWCAHIFYFGHRQFSILTNERTLFTIIVSAKSISNIEIVLPQTVEELLERYEIPKHSSTILLKQLSEVQFRRNTNRQVLGSMNDFIKNAKFILEDTPDISLIDLSLQLCQMPCSPIQMKSPKKAILEILT